MPFQSSQTQSKLLSPLDPEPSPSSSRLNLATTFPLSFSSLMPHPFAPTSRDARSPPSLSPRSRSPLYLNSRNRASWWDGRGLTTIEESSPLEEGVLAQSLIGGDELGRWGGIRGRRKFKAVMEIVSLFVAGFALLVLVVWCSSRVGRGMRGMGEYEPI
jgi:hypothetical protein